MGTETERCLECGRKLGQGRPDRKFCCTECKNRYHNRMQSRNRNIKAKTMNQIERNYEILDGLLRLGINSIGKEEALHMGFRSGFVTSFRKQRTRITSCCFDISYRDTEERIWSIRRASLMRFSVNVNQNDSLTLQDRIVADGNDPEKDR